MDGDHCSRPPAAESRAALCTRRFYDWEYRTRGYLSWPYPVSPEPPFRPFPGHCPPAPFAADDARKPTVLSALADSIRSAFAPKPREAPPVFPEEEDEEAPDLCVPEGKIAELQVILPPGCECRKRLAEQFLQSLRYAHSPIAFEVIGSAGRIWMQLAVREHDREQVLAQLEAYLPEAAIAEEDLFSPLWEDPRNGHGAVFDFGLDRESMLLLERTERPDADPLIGIVGALGLCRESDVGIFQALLAPARNPWAESLLRAASDGDGRPFLTDAPEILKGAWSKVERPLYGAVFRVGARSPSEARANAIVKALGGALAQLDSPGSNSLIPLHNEDCPDEIHAQNVAERLTNRSGMLLNLDELAGFVHFPSRSVRSARFLREARKTKPAPGISEGRRLVLGENRHRGRSKPVTLDAEQRLRHAYLVGASGTGKSTLLLNLAAQDLRNGEGLAVLDPHGDLVDRLLDLVPEDRFEDVLLFDPGDEEYPVAFNVFAAHSEAEKTLLASDLVAVFRRLSGSWGDQMNSVLANGILAMLESRAGGTLLTLRRFLIEADFRQRFLETVEDPEIAYYWRKEFPLLSGRPQGPVLTRLDSFLRPKPIRRMVAQRENRIDFGGILNGRKILLAKLAQGGIGEENAHLLGALLVAKLHQAALARQALPKEMRPPFYLYIDEFQNFVTPSMESILSGARKFGLGLVLAHQELRQLEARDREVASSVLSNPYTRICFRLGDQDASRLSAGFSSFDAKDLQSLPAGQAVARIEQAEYDFNLRTYPPPEAETDRERRQALIGRSRARYGTPRLEALRKLAEEDPYPAPEAAEEAKAAREDPDGPRLAGRGAPPEKPAPEKPAAAVRPNPGRGGAQHRYLQQLIKRLAEERGYLASVEHSVLDGQGVVDVSLEAGTERIACEISVSTSPAHELDNIRKCLAAGYGAVLVLCHEKGQLSRIRQLAAESLAPEARGRIRCLAPEDLVRFLDERQAARAEQRKTVRGYRVKVNYKATDPAAQQQKQDAIARLIAGSMRKMRS